jgi:hypothetical protein
LQGAHPLPLLAHFLQEFRMIAADFFRRKAIVVEFVEQVRNP